MSIINQFHKHIYVFNSPDISDEIDYRHVTTQNLTCLCIFCNETLPISEIDSVWINFPEKDIFLLRNTELKFYFNSIHKEFCKCENLCDNISEEEFLFHKLYSNILMFSVKSFCLDFIEFKKLLIKWQDFIYNFEKENSIQTISDIRRYIKSLEQKYDFIWEKTNDKGLILIDDTLLSKFSFPEMVELQKYRNIKSLYPKNFNKLLFNDPILGFVPDIRHFFVKKSFKQYKFPLAEIVNILSGENLKILGKNKILYEVEINV